MLGHALTSKIKSASVQGFMRPYTTQEHWEVGVRAFMLRPRLMVVVDLAGAADHASEKESCKGGALKGLPQRMRPNANAANAFSRATQL
jgi:hypothetical protein